MNINLHNYWFLLFCVRVLLILFALRVVISVSYIFVYVKLLLSTMSVYYKFKSALSFDTVIFDGVHISLQDLKKAIVKKVHSGKKPLFDLQITNAQTKEGKFK